MTEVANNKIMKFNQEIDQSPFQVSKQSQTTKKGYKSNKASTLRYSSGAGKVDSSQSQTEQSLTNTHDQAPEPNDFGIMTG